MTAHSILSASSAERWGACPISLAGKQVNTTSSAAAEGTFLHGVCESVLIAGDSKYPMLGTEHEVEGFKFEFTQSMKDDCEMYVAYVRSRPWLGRYEVEGTVYYSRALEVPYATAFGTADCFGFTQDSDGQRWLEIIDLKMGRKPVNPEKNPQAALYAAGVMEYSDDVMPIPDSQPIRITIIQPRLAYRPFSWETTAGEIRKMIRVLRPAAQAGVAFFKGEATDLHRQQFPENPGSHCGYCRRKAECDALRKVSLDAAKAPLAVSGNFDLKVFELRGVIRDYLDELEEYALDAALSGYPMPGTKLVRGRKGNPKLKVSEAELIAFGERYSVPETEIAPVKRTLLTAAKARDLFKKVGVPAAAIDTIIETPEGALQIASINDPRAEERPPRMVDDLSFGGEVAQTPSPAQNFVL